MKALELTAVVDAHHRLQLDLPATAAPGPVRVLVLLPEAEEATPTAGDEVTDADWMQGIARAWHTELADVREDIYTLEDGEPIREAR